MRSWPWAALGLPVPVWLAWLAVHSIELQAHGERLYVAASVGLAVGGALGWFVLAWAWQHRRVSVLWPFGTAAAFLPWFAAATEPPLTDGWLAAAGIVLGAAAAAWLLALPGRWVAALSGTGALIAFSFAVAFLVLPRDPDVRFEDLLWPALILAVLGLLGVADVLQRLRGYQRRAPPPLRPPERPPPERPAP